MSVTDSDAGHLEGEGNDVKTNVNNLVTNNDDNEGKAVRKRTKKERKRTNLGPRIKVLRLVTGEESEATDQTEVEENKSGVKVSSFV